MFYIYSKKGWAREKPTNKGNWWGTLATAEAYPTAYKAIMALRSKQRELKEFRNAGIMEVNQL